MIDVLRGAQHVHSRLASRQGPVLTSAIVVHQVLRGIRKGEASATHRLIDGLEIVPVGRGEAVLAARWRREFGREGVTLHLADALIAASAVTHGVPLATANVKDFSDDRADRRALAESLLTSKLPDGARRGYAGPHVPKHPNPA